MSSLFLASLFFASFATSFFAMRAYFLGRPFLFDHRLIDSRFSEHHSLFLGLSTNLWTGLYFFSLSLFVFFTYFSGGYYWVFIFILLLFGSLFSVYMMFLRVFVFKDFSNRRFLFGSIPIIFLLFFIFFSPFILVFSYSSALYDHLFSLLIIFSFIGSILALFSFFVFVFSMKDMLISKKEAIVMSLISDTMWLLIFGLLAVNLVLMTVVDEVFEMRVISLVMGIVVVVAICEYTKILRIRPLLVLWSLRNGKRFYHEREILKRLAFGVESISLISWFSITFFLVTPSGLVDFFQAIGMYMLLIVVAFLLSQLTTSSLYEGDE